MTRPVAKCHRAWLLTSNLLSLMLTMGSPSYWQKTDTLEVDDSVRELFDAARPLPSDVEYTATDSRLGFGTMFHMAVGALFFGVSVYFTFALLLDPLPESKYPWVAWAAIGVAFAISGIAGLDALDAWRIKRVLDAGKIRYGMFFTPTALVQHGVKDTLVLEARFIQRFEMETRKSGADQRHMKYEVCVAVLAHDHGPVSVDLPKMWTTEQYESWLTRARRVR